MRVEQGDESYAGSTDDETEEIEVDHEVSFRQSRSRSRSRSRTTSQSRGSTSTSDNKSSRSSSHQNSEDEEAEPLRNPNQIDEINQIRDRQQRIKELDIEMKEKLQEIQTLMREGGLDESASYIAERMMKRPKLSQPPGTNHNSNSSNKKHNKVNTSDFHDSESEETIYQRAVKSNLEISSGEEMIDTSDELIAVNFDNVDVISPKISERRNSGQGHRRDDGDIPSTSRGDRSRDLAIAHNRVAMLAQPMITTPEQISQQKIHDAEMS